MRLLCRIITIDWLIRLRKTLESPRRNLSLSLWQSAMSKTVEMLTLKFYNESEDLASSGNFDQELVACGQELGVVGPFSHNVRHYVSSCTAELKLFVCRWAEGPDMTNGRGSVLDIAVSGENDTVHRVGDCETPWTRKLQYDKEEGYEVVAPFRDPITSLLNV